VTGPVFHCYRSTPALCITLLAALALGGCRDKEKYELPPIIATPRNPLDIPLVEKPAPPAPQQTPPPLRRALSNFIPLPDRLNAALNTTDLPFIAFQFSRDAGQINMRARLAPSSGDPAAQSVGVELEALGFKKIEELSWSRSMSPEERAAFEQLAWKRLSEANNTLGAIESKALLARKPGQLLRRPDAGFYPGKLFYTGNPLDFAFADSLTFLSLKVHHGDTTGGVEETDYVRGGRLFVDSKNRLQLEEGRLPGEWKDVPQNTAQLAIKPDGRVLAIATDGAVTELGRLELRRAELQNDSPLLPPTLPALTDEAHSTLRIGHLEIADLDSLVSPALQARSARRVLETLLATLSQPAQNTAAPSSGNAAPASATPVTLTLHADLPWTEKHLKALGITAERTPGLTTIAAGKDPAATVAALAKVLQGLRLRMSIHEQNLRNAERVRDADNRINPYRRKILEIGPQGEPLEKADPSPLQKVSKPGDPNADADGFVMLPNVNRAVETSEFQSAADEYKLIRSALERLAPEHIFPDPIALPQQ
jgi:flagellar basal-body rod protein FlgC